MLNYLNNTDEGYGYAYRNHQVKAKQRIILNTSYGTLAIKLVDDCIIGRVDIDTTHHVIDLTPVNAMKAGVSRQHVYMMRQKEQVFIGDMQSSNGTYLNNTQLISHRLYPLYDGDILRLGKLTICVRFA